MNSKYSFPRSWLAHISLTVVMWSHAETPRPRVSFSDLQPINFRFAVAVCFIFFIFCFIFYLKRRRRESGKEALMKQRKSFVTAWIKNENAEQRLPFSNLSDGPSTPTFAHSCQTDRRGWLTRFREVKVRWCHLDRQSSPVNTAGMASDLGRITLSWQRCEVMSACDEIIMRAHLPACDVSTTLAWLSTV